MTMCSAAVEDGNTRWQTVVNECVSSALQAFGVEMTLQWQPGHSRVPNEDPLASLTPAHEGSLVARSCLLAGTRQRGPVGRPTVINMTRSACRPFQQIESGRGALESDQ